MHARSHPSTHPHITCKPTHAVPALVPQGTDARLSGHFTYATSPDFTLAPPLRCTNRTEVTAWLSSFGVNELRAEGSVGPLPGKGWQGFDGWVSGWVGGRFGAVRELHTRCIVI